MGVRREHGGEVRLRTIVERLADGVLIVGRRDGVVRFANPAAEALFGRGADALRGTALGLPLVTDETVELDVVRPGRAPGVAELRAVEIDWEGDPALLVSLRDVTDRRHAEEMRLRAEREQAARVEAEAAARRADFLAGVSHALAASLAPRATLAQLAGLAVPELGDWCVIDLRADDGRLDRVAAVHVDPARSDAAARLAAEFPPADGVPFPAAEAIHGGAPVIHSPLDDGTLARVTRGPEHAAVLRDLGAAAVMAVPLRARGETLGAATFGRAQGGYGDADRALAEDFAQRAAMAVSNARLYEQAQQASKAKSEFLAVMSHELRTPLNAILGYVDLLDAGVYGPVDARQHEQLQRIDGNARHLLEIVEEILSFSRMEAGEERIRRERTDLRTIVRQVGEMMEPDARRKELRLEVALPDEPAPVETDPARLRQVLANLVSNAVKFTDDGGVTVRAVRDHTHHLVTVEDTGVGIEPENLARIFDPFWQVEQSSRREVGGTGLGLSVAKDLAALLGADLRVESEPGRGSTFTLRVPALD